MESQIKGEGFLLRAVKKEDKLSLVKHANNKKIADNLRDRFPHPYTENDAEKFIEFILAKNEHPMTHFVIDVDGEAAGGIGIFLEDDVYRKNAELGYWLSESYWGHGIMTKAVKEMVRYTFKNFDIFRIYATPYSTSLGSMKVLEKAGFKHEAILHKSVFKNDKFLDQHVYYLLKDEEVP